MVALVKKGGKFSEIAKGHFSKITELLDENLLERLPIQNIQ